MTMVVKMISGHITIPQTLHPMPPAIMWVVRDRDVSGNHSHNHLHLSQLM